LLSELRAKHGQELEDGWKRRFGTASTALLDRKPGASSAPRMLNPSEIALPRQSKQEIQERLLKAA
jgi:hypothetical protein